MHGVVEWMVNRVAGQTEHCIGDGAWLMHGNEVVGGDFSVFNACRVGVFIYESGDMNLDRNKNNNMDIGRLKT